MESRNKEQERALRRQLCRETSEKIKADNERLRAERNAKRWKAERDPLEYERQKDKQRQEYAAERGGEVRSYEKIKAATKSERDDIRKARDASRKKATYVDQSPSERQAEVDRKADHQFAQRRRKKGMAEDVIQAELATHIEEREAKRAAKAQAEQEYDEMVGLPNFGMF